MSKSSKISFGNIQLQNTFFEKILKEKKGCLILDENTKICREQLINSPLYELPYLVIKPGEKNKKLEQVVNIWEFLNSENLKRNDLAILLGGGVLSDMGAFAASTFKRGIGFISIPTTLLAMVDAAIGGKTGFNFNQFKNNIGTFNEPLHVFCDVNFLKTLPATEILSGMGEVFKHAIIQDNKLWDYLKKSDPNKLDYNYLTEKSANIKLAIVEKDPFEKNVRKSLNLGHTIGHAIESYYIDKNSPILHGFGVAKGLIIESFISYKKKLLSKNDFLDIKSTIENYFKGYIDYELDIPALIKLMTGDKKNNSASINFTLPVEIGKVEIDQNIGIDEVKQLLSSFVNND